MYKKLKAINILFNLSKTLVIVNRTILLYTLKNEIPTPFQLWYAFNSWTHSDLRSEREKRTYNQTIEQLNHYIAEWNLRSNIQSKELYNCSMGMKDQVKNSRIFIWYILSLCSLECNKKNWRNNAESLKHRPLESGDYKCILKNKPRLKISWKMTYSL